MSVLSAVRTSGWPTRAAAVVAVAGLAAGLAHTRPAEAHGTGRHHVRVNGRMLLRDVDGGLNGADEKCEHAFSREATLQRTRSNRWPVLNLSFQKECDEVTGTINLAIEYREDRYVDTSGTIRATETDCVIFCITNEIGKKPFNGFQAENHIERFGPQTLSKDYGEVTFEWTVVVNG